MASRELMLACICHDAFHFIPLTQRYLMFLVQEKLDRIDLLIFLGGCVNAGSVRVKPTSPVTVRPGRCGLRKLLKWNQRNVSTYVVSSSTTSTLDIFWGTLIKVGFFSVAESHFHFAFLLPFTCSSASGWCEWSLRRCCQLSVVALQCQTLRQLQVSHTEKWGLQPHAVCKGNVAEPHWSQNSVVQKEFCFMLFYGFFRPVRIVVCVRTQMNM